MKLPMRKWLRWTYIGLGSAAGALTAMAFISYRIVFRGPLSHDPNDWIVFGTYFGGILGPGYAALAFVGLLLTLKVSQDTLDATNAQNRVSELERVLLGKMEEIDETIPKFYAGIAQAMDSVLRGSPPTSYISSPG